MFARASSGFVVHAAKDQESQALASPMAVQTDWTGQAMYANDVRMSRCVSKRTADHPKLFQQVFWGQNSGFEREQHKTLAASAVKWLFFQNRGAG